ncbi:MULTISPECIES: glycoside hydrolase family 97 protein [Pseudoalteromonas]|uniref:glycoside hydrolase family 97 protein n=1 Tax=Pseudoalteromonas TaxID=53246 RepID=UPI000301B76E|nr:MULTISPECIES: glycoside hydrolase family 97 protein [Pseudoalteromonas]MCF6146681.1 hypothetical protein [Pseudoalteromonas mariniglutinosa NCIMB 1770]
MRFVNRIGLLFAALVITTVAQATEIATIRSPDQQLTVLVDLDEQGQLSYQVRSRSDKVIEPSLLGITLNNTDFTKRLSLAAVLKQLTVNDSYELFTGKQQFVDYRANSLVVSVTNQQDQILNIRFQVSNDGVAFRYELAGETTDTRVVMSEQTGFNFPDKTLAWLQPKAEAQTGWMNTNPSYEEEYLQAAPVTTAAITNNGWVYPALFKHNEQYILVSEAGGPDYYSGTNLSNSSQGQFKVRFPDQREVITSGGYLPEHTLPLLSPWRILAIGSLKTITESTLGTDLARVNQLKNTDFIKPGIAAWSWGLLKDDFTTFPVQKQFIDYAADMHWQYVLIDADWDQKIGWDKIQQLATYAKQKNVDLWVWYNSSGAWNNTVYSPKSALLTHADRIKHFAKLQAMGIKGIKVDFFPGDGSSVMAYYEAILQDAAAHQLMVNFHGTTLPRGLQRTYPNLMTSEAVKGFEMISFFQAFADKEAQHAATLVFTRNVFDPMDFTPMVLGDIPTIERKTNNAFQLALPILFTSGVQHLVTTPEQMAKVSAPVKTYLQSLPTVWDETRLLQGSPGEHVVMARRRGCNWYIAGINAEDNTITLDIDLSFSHFSSAQLLSAGKKLTEVETQQLDSKQLSIKLNPNSGFVIITKGDNYNECTTSLAH